MKRGTKRIVSILLVLCMCMAMLPQVLPVAKAVTPDYTVSSAYQASSYYSALLAVELTGNQREDIINVALSQVGYTEGSYSGDYGGADDGSYSNYTEYNYWYNNYVNSGMPVGGSYAPWCATFVSWCARRANIPTSILNNSTAAGHASYYFDVNFYAGGSTLASSSDNDSYFMGYNYTPKKGDLFFTRSWSHVGLVVDSDGTYVTTVEGNTNDGGSAEGCGVFVRTRYVDDLYFGVPEYEEDYASSSCTFYPAHCQITIDSATPINTQPCSVSTEADSVNLGTAAAGQTFTATGLYLNGYGNYWYRIESDLGDNCYLYAGDTTYVGQITSDITFTDYDVPSAHLSGNTFSVTGTIASKYNRLDTAACYIYSGFGQGGEAVTGYSDSVGSYTYVLDNSTVDYNTSFGSLGNGNYTYEISTTYTNYYATSNTTSSSNTGTIRLLDEYFVVIPSSADQSSCSHSYTTTNVGGSVCTDMVTTVKACSTCGLITQTTAAGSHSYSGWTTTTAATCTADGAKKRTCSVCGNVETQAIAASGHDYACATTAATCQEYEIYELTCGNCGDYYTLNAGELTTTWIDQIPAGLDSSLFNSKTQYRYSDYQTTTSYETSLDGYTLKSSQWVQSGTGSVEYVPSWPSGFSTSSSLYTTYNKASSKVTSGETATTRTTVDSDAVSGYLYYHWCYTDSYYSAASSSGSYTTFHAYYDTTDPSNYTCDTSDMSYKTSSSNCSNTNWWFVTDVYQQDHTTYQKLFTYERWTDFSSWSDTAVTASETRQVESRTVYQLKSASLGDHVWSNGTCSVCGTSQSGEVDYYLFGYINGANYACEEDHANTGSYKFVDGKLTATFDQVSYVAVKTGDNSNWYMTNGWQGEVSSATLYSTTVVGSSADKLYVPGGVEVIFTLVDNGDGTLTLSYEKAAEEEVVTPTLTLSYPSLELESQIQYNVYYTASDLDSVVEMGLITFSSKLTDGTIDDAVDVIPGHYTDGSIYMAHTNGIPAKNLGDVVYFKVYAKLSDGSYAYSSVAGFNAAAYAKSILAGSSNSADIKALAVALVNYGAEAQLYFGYDTGNLVNAFLTDAQKALVTDYSGDMVDGIVAAASSKTGYFIRNTTAFPSMYPSIAFDGAFGINYYFVNGLTVDDTMTLYYWTTETYNSVGPLTAANATGTITMVQDGSRYWAQVSGIAAKEIDQTIYVAGVYTSGGTKYTTGIVSYSLGAYCESVAGNASNDAQALAAATCVYSYYAKTYFANQS